MSNLKVTGKIVIHGHLLLKSPLIIGGGEGRYGDSDIVVLKDPRGNPYIPGTTLAGVLRSHFYRLQYNGNDIQRFIRQRACFWGESGGKSDESADAMQDTYYENGCPSALIVNDAVLARDSAAVVRVRDGIKIDNTKGIAQDGFKYDYETVEPGEKGTYFDIKMEITLREGFDEFKSFAKWIVIALEQGKVSFGAMTGKGFGRCCLVDPQYCYYNFARPEHVLAWLKNESVEWPEWELTDVPGLDCQSGADEFIMDAAFSIKYSLIVRSYSGNPEDPDAVQMARGDQAVLPGTSIKGAIRARAERIVNTLGGNQDMLRELFGWAVPDGKTARAIRGRVIVEETPVNMEAVTREIQKRIRIDRFTGGVMNAALFDSMPLWPVAPGDDPMICVKVTIKDYRAWEAGLLLLVLKDLWNGDLPLGGEKNIGRGVLNGISARIIAGCNGEILMDAQGPGLIRPEDADLLESYVQALSDKISQVNGEVRR